MKIKDMKDIVTLLAYEWDLGKKSSNANGNICAWVYLFEIIEESEKIIVEKKDNKVIGACGYSKWKSKKHLFRKSIFKFLKNVLIHSPLVKNKKALLEYHTSYNYMPKSLENYFDGEISILIVDKNYRNLGLGKKMIEKIFNLAKDDNMNNIQILTDDSCNYKFYEDIGCKKIYETKIYNGEPNKCSNELYENAYIYEMKFKV